MLARINVHLSATSDGRRFLRISRLTLRNFRAFEHLDLDVSPGMNVIVGENNVGKSILMQAVQLAMSSPRGSQLTRDYWPDGNPKGPLSISMEIVLSKEEFETISSSIPDPQKNLLRDHVVLSISWRTPGHVGESQIEFVDNPAGKVTARLRMGFQGYTTDADGAAVIGEQGYPFVGRILGGFYHFPEFRQRPAGGEIGEEESPRSTEGARLAAVLFRLKNGSLGDRDMFERIQHSFHGMYSNLELQVIKKSNQPTIMIKRSETNHELPLAEVGAGILEMLLVLTHIVDQQDRIFAIDEPEAHLHPHSQRLLANELVRSSVKNQILLITHSPHFVNFKDLHSIMLVRQHAGRSSVVRLPSGYLSKDEEARASRIIWSEDKEFLFSRRVLLVEGETEYSAMPILARKLGKGFDENGVTVISVGGQHFGLFIKILKGFEFPFRVMCDKDALMRISGSVQIGQFDMKVSSLFKAAFQAGMIGEREEEMLWDCQESISPPNKENKTEFYDEELFTDLNALALKLGFHTVSPDLEGYLNLKGFESVLKEANELYRNNKILKGRFVAETVRTVPPELAAIISEAVSL